MSFRVLVITPWFPNKPGEQQGNFIYHSLRALSELGNTVCVLVTRPWTPRIFGLLRKEWIRPPLNPNVFLNLEMVRQVNYLSIPRYILRDLSGSLSRLSTDKVIGKIIRDYDIQIIHAHTEDVGYGAVRLGQRIGIPVVLTIHGINTSVRLLDTRRKRNILRDTLNKADRVILVGESLRSYFSPLAGRSDHFRVVPNGFYLPDSFYNCKEKKWGKKLKVISVSNLCKEKGIDLTLEALARLSQQGFCDWTYEIIGDGEERKRLETMTKELGLEDNVYFQGALSHNDALLYLKGADVFLLPSYKEAFGVAYLEAMVSGLLTIGVGGQGPEDFINNGVTGYLVPPRDVDAIYSLLRYIIDNPTEVAEIAASGCEYVRREFTWDKHARKLMAIYQEAMLERQ